MRAAKQDNASTKRQRKERNIRSSKSVNESQPPVDGHQVDTVHPQTSTHVHYSDVAGTTEHPISTLPVNQEDFHGVQEISINYTTSAVDGRRDHISLWVTRFGHIHESS